MKSHLEEKFLLWVRQEGLPEPEREYRFAPPRKWRMDFVWHDAMIAVEIEGGLYKGGRHQTLNGFLADAAKYEAALALGWRVYRVPGPWIAEGERLVWRPQVMETLRKLLGIT